jgi:putative intracellular protease/amidase/catechol 2,3-dioxygenase-like lactoylglutathione lyase family enzyme
MTPTRQLTLLIFDDVEVLDFCGPFEVFSVANHFTQPPAFRVAIVAEKAGPVLARNGLSVNPHHRLADCPPPDLLLIPGGQGTRREMHNQTLIDWIRHAAAKAELVLSVCTGALLLAKAGLLDGLAATTHHGAMDLLRQVAPRTTVLANRRFVDNGRVICSAGIAAGIDMSLHIARRLLGMEVAVKTAQQMEYPWQPSEGMIRDLHHVQLTVPQEAEAEARRFYCQTLGLSEVDKPPSLVERGGLWLQVGNRQVHIGVEDGVERLATKAHIAYEVSDLSGWEAKLAALGIEVVEGLPIPGYDRFEFRDPFGNRVEFLERQ